MAKIPHANQYRQHAQHSSDKNNTKAPKETDYGFKIFVIIFGGVLIFSGDFWFGLFFFLVGVISILDL